MSQGDGRHRPALGAVRTSRRWHVSPPPRMASSVVGPAASSSSSIATAHTAASSLPHCTFSGSSFRRLFPTLTLEDIACEMARARAHQGRLPPSKSVNRQHDLITAAMHLMKLASERKQKGLREDASPLRPTATPYSSFSAFTSPVGTRPHTQEAFSRLTTAARGGRGGGDSFAPSAPSPALAYSLSLADGHSPSPPTTGRSGLASPRRQQQAGWHSPPTSRRPPLSSDIWIREEKETHSQPTSRFASPRHAVPRRRVETAFHSRLAATFAASAASIQEELRVNLLSVRRRTLAAAKSQQAVVLLALSPPDAKARSLAEREVEQVVRSTLDTFHQTLHALVDDGREIVAQATQEFERQQVAHEMERPCTVTAESSIEWCAITFLPREFAADLEAHATTFREQAERALVECVALMRAQLLRAFPVVTASALTQAASETAPEKATIALLRQPTYRNSGESMRPLPRTSTVVRPDYLPATKHAAAVKIQALYRGYQARCEIRIKKAMRRRYSAQFGHLSLDLKPVTSSRVTTRPTTRGASISTAPAIELPLTVIEVVDDQLVSLAAEAEAAQRKREAAAAVKLQALARGRVARQSVFQKRQETKHEAKRMVKEDVRTRFATLVGVREALAAHGAKLAQSAAAPVETTAPKQQPTAVPVPHQQPIPTALDMQESPITFSPSIAVNSTPLPRWSVATASPLTETSSTTESAHTPSDCSSPEEVARLLAFRSAQDAAWLKFSARDQLAAPTSP